MKYIVEYDGKGIEIGRRVQIPEKAAVIIISNCGTCDWHYRTAGGKFFCSSPKILAKRPYCKTLDDTGREINTERRPEWCPYK